jgi:hypothetical protein
MWNGALLIIIISFAQCIPALPIVENKYKVFNQLFSKFCQLRFYFWKSIYFSLLFSLYLDDFFLYNINKSSYGRSPPLGIISLRNNYSSFSFYFSRCSLIRMAKIFSFKIFYFDLMTNIGFWSNYLAPKSRNPYLICVRGQPWAFVWSERRDFRNNEKECGRIYLILSFWQARGGCWLRRASWVQPTNRWGNQ